MTDLRLRAQKQASTVPKETTLWTPTKRRDKKKRTRKPQERSLDNEDDDDDDDDDVSAGVDPAAISLLACTASMVVVLQNDSAAFPDLPEWLSGPPEKAKKAVIEKFNKDLKASVDKIDEIVLSEALKAAVTAAAEDLATSELGDGDKKLVLCPVPECVSFSSSNRTQLLIHLRNKHGDSDDIDHFINAVSKFNPLTTNRVYLRRAGPAYSTDVLKFLKNSLKMDPRPLNDLEVLQLRYMSLMAPIYYEKLATAAGHETSANAKGKKKSEKKEQGTTPTSGKKTKK